MAALYRVTPQTAAEQADEIREQLAARILSRPELDALLERFKFRDQEGDTWTIGPLSKKWYSHHQGKWSGSQAMPAGGLDSPADLDLPGKLDHRPLPEEPPVETARDKASTDDLSAYIESAVARVTQAYADGTIHSDAAEALLGGIYAVDASGTVWTLGVQSRKWYTFTEDGWQRSKRALNSKNFSTSHQQAAAGQPKFCGNCGQSLPADARFCSNCGTAVPKNGNAEVDPRAVEKIKSFLTSTANRLPEPIVPSWTPPGDFPESVEKCPHCEALNVGEVQNCVSCERPLHEGPEAAGTPMPTASRAPAPSAAPASAAQPAQPTPSVSLRTASGIPASASTSRSRPRWLWWLVGAGSCLAIVCVCALSLLVLGPYIYNL